MSAGDLSHLEGAAADLMSPEIARMRGMQGTSLDDPSGARRAQEAHDAGAVLPHVELPTHDASIAFRVHGAGRDARELVDAIAAKLAEHPLVVPPVTCSVVER